MNTRLASSLRHLQPANILSQPMFADRISLWMLVSAVAINLIAFAALILRVHFADHPVAVHYSSLVGFDQEGAWYSVYRLPAYGLAVTLVNGALAMKSFHRNRLSSFYLLLASIVVAVLCLIISMAFAAIV